MGCEIREPVDLNAIGGCGSSQGKWAFNGIFLALHLLLVGCETCN